MRFHLLAILFYFILIFCACDECDYTEDCNKNEFCIESSEYWEGMFCKEVKTKRCNTKSDCKSCKKIDCDEDIWGKKCRWICIKNKCIYEIYHDGGALSFDYVTCPEVNGTCTNTEECRETYQADCKGEDEEFTANANCPGTCINSDTSECTEVVESECVGENVEFTANASCPEG